MPAAHFWNIDLGKIMKLKNGTDLCEQQQA